MPPSPPKGGGEGGNILVPTGPGEKEKESANLRQALALVDQGLTESELKALYDHLALRLQALATTGSEGNRDLDTWSTAVYAALTEANGGGGAGMPGPLVVKRLVGVRSCWAPVSEFAAQCEYKGITVAERASLFTLLAKLLVERSQQVARHAGIPLTVKLVANNSADIAAIVNGAFPGYGASGLLPFMVKQLVRSRDEDR